MMEHASVSTTMVAGDAVQHTLRKGQVTHGTLHLTATQSCHCVGIPHFTRSFVRSFVRVIDWLLVQLLARSLVCLFARLIDRLFVRLVTCLSAYYIT